MAAVNEELQLNYIKTQLIAQIVGKLENEELIAYTTEHASGLDGFMSALYNVKLQTRTLTGQQKERLIILKFMRGENSFRESSNSYIQCANEVYVYAEILPAYAKLLAAAEVKQISVADWVPTAYKSQFGFIEGLSTAENSIESVLALENLKPLGYKISANLELTHEELLLMCKPLAQYHALSYAMRLIDPAQLQELQNGIKALTFHPDDELALQKSLFRVLHGLGFERFFDYYDRKLSSEVEGSKLQQRLLALRKKYGAEPTRLLEHLRLSVNATAEDEIFGVILHGDYNRNNVLFQYEHSGSSEETAVHAKMIDFQELRYGSPGIDISFFMYMNTPAARRNDWWMDILKAYHKHMFETLTLVLKAYNAKVKPLPKFEKFLQKYEFDNFYKHFSKFAFYGVIICMHYMPWLLCSKDECQELTNWFEKDMHSPDFRKISLEAGGDDANYQILDVIKHACEMGYMDSI